MPFNLIMMEYSAGAQLNSSDCTQLSILVCSLSYLKLWIPQLPRVPLKIAGAKPLQFSHNKKLMDVPNFQEFHWKLQGRSPCNFPTIWSLWFQQYCRKCFCWCPILQFCRICFCCCPIQQFWLAFLLVPNPAVFHRSEAPALHILTYEFDMLVRSR